MRKRGRASPAPFRRSIDSTTGATRSSPRGVFLGRCREVTLGSATGSSYRGSSATGNSSGSNSSVLAPNFLTPSKPPGSRSRRCRRRTWRSRLRRVLAGDNRRTSVTPRVGIGTRPGDNVRSPSDSGRAEGVNSQRPCGVACRTARLTATNEGEPPRISKRSTIDPHACAVSCRSVSSAVRRVPGRIAGPLRNGRFVHKGFLDSDRASKPPGCGSRAADFPPVRARDALLDGPASPTGGFPHPWV